MTQLTVKFCFTQMTETQNQDFESIDEMHDNIEATITKITNNNLYECYTRHLVHFIIAQHSLEQTEKAILLLMHIIHKEVAFPDWFCLHELLPLLIHLSASTHIEMVLYDPVDLLYSVTCLDPGACINILSELMPRYLHESIEYKSIFFTVLGNCCYGRDTTKKLEDMLESISQDFMKLHVTESLIQTINPYIKYYLHFSIKSTQGTLARIAPISRIIVHIANSDFVDTIKLLNHSYTSFQHIDILDKYIMQTVLKHAMFVISKDQLRLDVLYFCVIWIKSIYRGRLPYPLIAIKTEIDADLDINLLQFQLKKLFYLVFEYKTLYFYGVEAVCIGLGYFARQKRLSEIFTDLNDNETADMIMSHLVPLMSRNYEDTYFKEIMRSCCKLLHPVIRYYVSENDKKKNEWFISIIDLIRKLGCVNVAEPGMIVLEIWRICPDYVFEVLSIHVMRLFVILDETLLEEYWYVLKAAYEAKRALGMDYTTANYVTRLLAHNRRPTTKYSTSTVMVMKEMRALALLDKCQLQVE
jgi:hypothetical protein